MRNVALLFYLGFNFSSVSLHMLVMEKENSGSCVFVELTFLLIFNIIYNMSYYVHRVVKHDFIICGFSMHFLEFDGRSNVACL